MFELKIGFIILNMGGTAMISFTNLASCSARIGCDGLLTIVKVLKEPAF